LLSSYRLNFLSGVIDRINMTDRIYRAMFVDT